MAREMSAAALQVRCCSRSCRRERLGHRDLTALAGDFFPQAAEIVERPWTLAAMRDFAYPGTRGERPADLEEQAQYFAALDALTAEDLEVQRLVTEVLNLAKPLSACGRSRCGFAWRHIRDPARKSARGCTRGWRRMARRRRERNQAPDR